MSQMIKRNRLQVAAELRFCAIKRFNVTVPCSKA